MDDLVHAVSNSFIFLHLFLITHWSPAIHLTRDELSQEFFIFFRCSKITINWLQHHIFLWHKTMTPRITCLQKRLCNFLIRVDEWKLLIILKIIIQFIFSTSDRFMANNFVYVYNDGKENKANWSFCILEWAVQK